MPLLRLPRPQRPTPRGVVKLAGTLLALAAALVVAGAVVVVALLPRVVHGQAMTVLTGSMTPTIPVGSVAMVRPVDPRTVEVGDVLTYQVGEGEQTFVTHRLKEITTAEDGQTLYVLQGDANDVEDDPVLGDRIRGEVWFHVPYLGAIRDGLHGRGGVWLVGTIVLGWFAFSQISGGLRERREEREGKGAGTVTLDRPLLLVRLEPGADVAMLAVDLGGVVVESGPDGHVLLLAAGPRGTDELDRALIHLGLVDVRSTHVVPAGTTLDLPVEEAPTPTSPAPIPV
ncbi:signal peptidase I [Nocardioides litoris]|uniref:signal peptidase I n=1 Tax=Nocardioides litoris TaxID=1926648 RepID=UPI001122CAB5|nr:signal peptidase I [Nocardioides litoris]